MLTTEQKEQFSDILEELGKSLDITETQYNAAVKSYEAVGDWLASEHSSLAPYRPEILPQGSFMLGTMVRPVNDEDDLDIDLVCQLEGKNPDWTQRDLKQKVGDQLKAHDLYEKLLDDEGRRCWTLLYRKNADVQKDKYHMDVLPCIVDSGYSMILEKAFSSAGLDDVNDLAIRITDNEEWDYDIETNHLEWSKSNPFGYGKWFFQQASLDISKAFSINESVQPVPRYSAEKLPLQRVVQILKRHRDMMFEGDEHKPISIIITTLAARAYRKQTKILVALEDVLAEMTDFIEERYSLEHRKTIKWIENPINSEENFADKWPEEPLKEEKFYQWVDQVRSDIDNIGAKRGLHFVQESLENSFGKNEVIKAFSSYGDSLRSQREAGQLKMASGTGMIGAIGTKVPKHNFDGWKEDK